MQVSAHQDSSACVLAEGGSHEHDMVARTYKGQGEQPYEFRTAIANQELLWCDVQMPCQYLAQGEHLTVRIAIIGHLRDGLTHPR